MSVTSGVVSRIEVTSYVHGAAELLGIQIDAVSAPRHAIPRDAQLGAPHGRAKPALPPVLAAPSPGLPRVLTGLPLLPWAVPCPPPTRPCTKRPQCQWPGRGLQRQAYSTRHALSSSASSLPKPPSPASPSRVTPVPQAINSGNSGGPAFDSGGRCVGIAFQSLKHEDAENIGYM